MRRSAFGFTILSICFFCFEVRAQVPQITSFSPTNGPVGTLVTINGSGFGATPSANTVYFGAVKAAVMSATATSLTVAAPSGATCQPITVTTANLTAAANGFFTMTFPSNPSGITTSSFAPKTDLVTGTDHEKLVAVDLDGDGKPDMVTANQNSLNISVYRNTGVGGVIAFAAKVDYTVGGAPMHVAAGDVDGDGKPDLAVANNSAGTVSVFKNTSTIGNISFAAKVDFAVRSGANCTAIGDLDGDGKPELVVTSNSAVAFSVLKNTSTAGVISFAAATDVFGSGFQNVSIADVDGDAKPDLIGGDNHNSFAVLLNTTTGGTISFTTRIPFATGMYNSGVCVGDMDGDGKPDIAVSFDASVSVFRNTSTSGNVSFATRADFASGSNARGLALGDVDGDGKPDLAVAASGAAAVSVFKNISSSGALAFETKVDYTTGLYPYSVVIADMNGDGKPDLSVATHNYTSSLISILKNQTDGPAITSFTPATAAAGSNLVISGAFFTGATAVSIGGVAVASFTVDSDIQITAVVPAITGGSVEVTTPKGSASIAGFYNGPTITSVSPTVGSLGSSVAISGTNFNPTASNNTVYVGAVRATVSSATSSSVNIAIPAGSTYGPVRLTTSTRTAYSAQALTTTFTSNTTGLTTNSFVAAGNGTSSEAIGDLDGDGKPDYVTYSYFVSSISVSRNVSTVGFSSFATSSFASNASGINSVSLGDLDGDNKLDIVVTYYSNDIVSIFRNTSTVGTISFATRQDVATGAFRSIASIHDIDGDGKPDLALARGSSSIVSLLRNTSVGSAISFAEKTDVSINSVTRVELGDLNADGKPEMVVANYYAGTVSVLRNTSIPGMLAFAAQIDYTTGSVPTAAIIGDFNGDGKPDLAVTNQGSSTVSVLKNESTGSALAFASATSFNTGVGPMALSAADVNGDGKLDLAVANGTAYSLSVLKNTTTGGTISFAPKLDFTTGANIVYTSTADYDGDGQPDIAVTGSILLNKTAGTDILSVSPLNAAAGTTAVISGINLTGATAVSFGGVAASSFTVNSDVQITATVAGVAGGKVLVTTPKGTATLNGFYNGPAITSFSPASGSIGATVTINGTNFNTTAANNTVYFGAVKAVVVAATATSLTVTVPTGATYQPISVTVGSLTGYSVKPFAVTFSSPAGGLNVNSFAPKVDFAAGTNPGCIATGDIDGDGKTDMIVGNTGSNIISVYKSTSSPGAVSFGTKLDMGSGYFPTSIAVGDINGDGKLDLAIIILNSRSIYVYRNTSTGGTISFASEVTVYTGNGSEPRQLVLSDLDSDGKPDMAIANSSGPVGIFKNTSTVSAISFAEKQEIAAAGGSPYSLAAADLDGDNKPDIAITHYTFYSAVTVVAVFKNLSQSGTILFDGKKDFIIGFNNKSISISDLDGDGKADLVITNITSNDVAVLRNTTTSGNISFADAISVLTGTAPYSVAISDFDGDEKQDLVVANSGAASASVLKNTSVLGTITFAAKQDYATGATPYNVIVADFDGNGRPDIATANSGANSFSVLRNQVGAPVITAFTPTNAAIGATITISGNNFTGATAVSIGGVTATSFTVVSDVEITAIVAASSGGDVTVTTASGTAALSGFYNGPVITAVSPLSGSIGATVTISGSNFNSTPANNTVYFGAVKATVSSGNSSSLTVTAPVGATYQPLTLTTNNLTAYSAKPFGITFSTNTTSFMSGAFAAKADFASGANPYSICFGDLDGDGKTDMIASSGANALSVLKNTGSSGTIAFAGKIDLIAAGAAVDVAATDINGDGKLDLIATNASANVVSVFRNTSLGGAISFAARLDYTTGNLARALAVADLTGDGKPDLVVTNGSSNTVSVFRNTSVGDAVSFATKADFATASSPSDVAIADMDGDGKPDIVVSNSSDYSVSVFRNTSNSSLSFATKVDFTTAGYVIGFAVGDLDGDGKPDIAAANYNSNILSLLRNQSVVGALSFAPKMDYSGLADPRSVAITDLDGDGKPELAVTNRNNATVSVFKNASSIGALSFAAKADYAVDSNPYAVTIGDLDGDGKPDIAVANYGANSISVLKNLLSNAGLCAGGSTSFTSNNTGTVYQWQVDAGSGFINLTDNANYSGTNTAILQLTNLSFAWSGYQYRCVVDGIAGNIFLLELKNYWTGAVSTAWEDAANWSCGVVPDMNTDVVISSGTVTVNSMAVCRSLKAGTGATVTVTTGFNLFIAK